MGLVSSQPQVLALRMGDRTAGHTDAAEDAI